MSGIAGIFRLDDRSVERQELTGMMNQIHHRGCNGRDEWTAGPVGLGHRMLWSTAESIDEQYPIVDRESGAVLVADARLDNRSELAGRLGLSGSLSSLSDGSLILA